MTFLWEQRQSEETIHRSFRQRMSIQVIKTLGEAWKQVKISQNDVVKEGTNETFVLQFTTEPQIPMTLAS